MRVYFEGRYINEKLTDKERDSLLREKPQLYLLLFPPVIPAQKRLAKTFNIYQVHYNETSEQRLDNGFIPYQNGSTHNYENDVIIDIWNRKDWVNSKYIGVLSWRFFDKTGFVSSQIKTKKDICIFVPLGYEKHEHPYSRKAYDSVNKIVQCADENNLFDFKLCDVDINEIVWCNYWIAKQKVFDDYCKNYLSKAIDFFKDRPEYNLTVMHRGRLCPAFTFFLEGLFSVFLSKRNYTYEVKRNTFQLLRSIKH